MPWRVCRKEGRKAARLFSKGNRAYSFFLLFLFFLKKKRFCLPFLCQVTCFFVQAYSFIFLFDGRSALRVVAFAVRVVVVIKHLERPLREGVMKAKRGRKKRNKSNWAI